MLPGACGVTCRRSRVRSTAPRIEHRPQSPRWVCRSMATPVSSVNGARGAYAVASGATEREFLSSPALQASVKDTLTPSPQQVGASTESILHAIAGGVGSALALALTYPLDQLRTYQQVDDSPDDDEEGRKHAWGLRLVHRTQALMERHGKGVLWRGILPVLVAMGVSNFVYFYTHSRLKGRLALLRRRGGHVGENGLRWHLADLSMAAIAGIVNVLITTPLWVASTRAKLSTHRQPEAIWTALHRIYREEGVRGLWSGTGPSLLLVSNPTVQFFLYDLLKRSALRVRRRRAGGAHLVTALGPLDAFFLGAIAKAVATLVSYPLQLVQCRLRLQEDRPSLLGNNDAGGGATEVRCYDGTMDCLAKLWHAKGVKGWFQGIESKLLQTITTAAFMFCMYERLFALTRALVLASQAPHRPKGL